MVVKTFRALLADGGQDHIRLSTIKGKVGYRIVKFQVIQTEPGQDNVESTMKLYTSEQTSVDNTVNFSDPDLLGVSYYSEGADYAAGWIAVVFDNVIFNQDIYITHSDLGENKSANYYIELETIELSDQGAEYTTIKDIRTQKQ